MQVDHDGFTVNEAGRGMKNSGVEPAGAYTSEFCSQTSVPTS
jgi:hypothetical protein